MGKPKWENAPSWAKFVAMDADGNWCWFEQKPYINVGFNQTIWCNRQGSNYHESSNYGGCDDWIRSVEARHD